MNKDTNLLADIFSIPMPKVKYQSKLQEWQGRRSLNTDDIVWLSKPKLEKFIEQAHKDYKKYQAELEMYTDKHPKFEKIKDKMSYARNIVDLGKENLKGRSELARDKKRLKKILDDHPFLTFYPTPISDHLDDNYPWNNTSSDYPSYELHHSFYIRDDRFMSDEYSDYGLDWEAKGYGAYEQFESDSLEQCIENALELIKEGQKILEENQ